MTGFPELPESIYDRTGHKIDLTGDKWPVNDSADYEAINWGRVSSFSDGALHAFRLYICECLMSKAPREAYLTFTDIRQICSLHPRPVQKIADMTLEVFRHYRQKLREKDQEYKLHRVRAWYRWMGAMEFPGVDHALASEIEKWRIPGNRKGEAVMSRDPRNGPLSSEEYLALLRAVREDCEPSQTLAVVLLGLELGVNVKQIILLQERDLHRFSDSSDGSTRYQLDVPRMKKRQPRRAVRRRNISTKLGALLEALICRNQKKLGDGPDERPLFCKTHLPRKHRSEEKRRTLHLTLQRSFR